MVHYVAIRKTSYFETKGMAVPPIEKLRESTLTENRLHKACPALDSRGRNCPRLLR